MATENGKLGKKKREKDGGGGLQVRVIKLCSLAPRDFMTTENIGFRSHISFLISDAYF